MTEVWKDIKNYEGLYQISNLGRVKSFPRKGTQTKEERILKYKYDKKGYCCVSLHNKKPKPFKVHRLVAMAFIENKEGKVQVNHIDGDKKNNRVDNLEWCTNGENQKHAYKIGLQKSTRKKKIKQYDLNNNFIKMWESITQASKELNIKRENISACCRGKQKTTCGYIWIYD